MVTKRRSWTAKWAADLLSALALLWSARGSKLTRTTRAIDELHPSLALDYVLEEAPAPPRQYRAAAVLFLFLGVGQSFLVLITGSQSPLVAGSFVTVLAFLWAFGRLVESREYANVVVRAAQRVAGRARVGWPGALQPPAPT